MWLTLTGQPFSDCQSFGLSVVRRLILVVWMRVRRRPAIVEFGIDHRATLRQVDVMEKISGYFAGLASLQQLGIRLNFAPPTATAVSLH